MIRFDLAIASAIVLGACHSEPFTPAFDGASGTLTDDSEAQLTFNPGNDPGSPYNVAFQAYAPTWTQDGGGILYSFSPRPHQAGEITHLGCISYFTCIPVPPDSTDRCIAMLPPTGGSAIWQRCETLHSHTDSTDILGAPAVSRNGALLYTEYSGPAGFQLGSHPHTDLWLATSADATTRRRLAAGDGIAQISWVGSNDFVAVDSTDHGSHLFRGVINDTGATFSAFDNTGGAFHFAIAGGTAAIFVDGSREIRRLDLATGAVDTLATLDSTMATSALDVGCHSDVCVVLSAGDVSGTPAWIFWRVDLASGAATAARTVYHPVVRGKLSPVSGDVVALEGRNLYLFKQVLP